MPNPTQKKDAASRPEGRKGLTLWPRGALIALGALIAVALVALAVQTYGPGDAPAPERPAPPSAAIPGGAEALDDTPVALVNGQPILRREYDEMLRIGQAQQGAAAEDGQPGEPPMDMRLEILNSLATMEVAVQEARLLGFSPSELEVESAINQMVGDYGSRDAFEKALPAFGTDLATVRRQVTNNLALRAWRDTGFFKEALATDEEARAFYDEHIEEARHPEQVRAVQIMIPVPLNGGQEDPQAKASVKARAEAIYREAAAGANFEELVDRNMDQATRAATSGGQMGWVGRGSLDFDELEEVLFGLEPGQVGGPVESQFSYHIVKAIERRPAGTMTFEELRPEILEYLLTANTERLFLAALGNLRKAASVEVLDPAMAEAWPAFREKLDSQIPPQPE
ncbi:MAG: peptidyl-prolyl cis-trans isomerase [Deltaproteobacteria bacterium]|jgi:peptidyl-prolyl cis-trans isomerase C|nr:peptidyl-prolyl cis-trans isomerase [Deltaproteobacteria bacterium]